MATTLSYVPAKVNLVLEQGDGWVEQWAFKRSDGATPPVKTDWNLSGWSVVAQIRDGPADTNAVVLQEILCEVLDPTTDGIVQTTLLGAETLVLPATCFWEIALVNPDNEETTVMTGKVTVQREVARRA